MTPDGVITDECQLRAAETGGCRLAGVLHSKLVVFRKATRAVEFEEDNNEVESIVEPPCRMLRLSVASQNMWLTHSKSCVGCATRVWPTRAAGTSPLVTWDDQPLSLDHKPMVVKSTTLPAVVWPPARTMRPSGRVAVA
jgi:hypothetical protein